MQIFNLKICFLSYCGVVARDQPGGVVDMLLLYSIRCERLLFDYLVAGRPLVFLSSIPYRATLYLFYLLMHRFHVGLSVSKRQLL